MEEGGATYDDPQEPRTRISNLACFLMFGGILLIFVVCGGIALSWGKPLVKMKNHSVAQTNTHGELTAVSIEFHSIAEHGKQIVSIPSVDFSRIFSYDLCCYVEGTNTLQCQTPANHKISKALDGQARLEMAINDDRLLDSNCRVAVWLK